MQRNINVKEKTVYLDPLKSLPKLVVAHATFQTGISGAPSEGALAYPILSFLRVKTNLAITAEENHPALNNIKSTRGRPPQIDFVGKNRKSWSFALETKIHGSGQDRSRIVQDVIKLLLLAGDENAKNARRLLLLLFPISSVGTKACASIVRSPTGDENVKLNQPVAWKPRKDEEEKYCNLFDVLLPWEQKEKSIFIGDLWPPLKNNVATILSDFGKNVRGDIKVKLIEKDWSDDFACGLWELGWRSPEKYFELPTDDPSVVNSE